MTQSISIRCLYQNLSFLLWIQRNWK